MPISHFSNPWIVPLKAEITPSVRLLCFHHSGGNTSTFKPWSAYLPSYVELLAVQLPGRGERFNERFVTDVEDIKKQILIAMEHYLDKPYILFGHSLGAMIAHEVAVTLQKEKKTLPHHLFVSGRRAPHIPRREEDYHTLSDTLLIEKIQEFNGTPLQIFDTPELISLFLPMLRADFKISETYRLKEFLPLRCNLTALGGTQDPTVTVEDIKEWKNYTLQDFQYHLFPGNHFFIHAEQQLVINLILSITSKF